jgi:hypothetical protein
VLRKKRAREERIEGDKRQQFVKYPIGDQFFAQCYQTLKKTDKMLSKLFHKVEREGMLPNSCYEVYLTLTQKLEETTK